MQRIAVYFVTMLSPFGPAIRGVSPYADQLFSALGDINDLDVGKLDYQSLYPTVLFPASTANAAPVENPEDSARCCMDLWEDPTAMSNSGSPVTEHTPSSSIYALFPNQVGKGE